MPSYRTYQDERPAASSSSASYGPSIIKFSAKDGKSALSSAGIVSRDSVMETQRKVIQYEQPDQDISGSGGANYRSPRRIKMGSFVHPRSFGGGSVSEGKTDGMFIQVCQ